MLELHSGNVEHPFKSSFVQGQSDVDIATNVQPTKNRKSKQSCIDKVIGLNQSHILIIWNQTYP